MYTMKGDKMAKRSSFGSMVRRRLSDITNSQPQPKSPSCPEKLPPDAASAKEYIDHLAKENMALVKLIQDKNKIIELTGIEIQNLRTCLQKMQLQNWNLAQANTHMLAELNLGKERLKGLQHEVMCKEALLKTKNLQLKGQGEVNLQKTELQEAVVTKESALNEDKSTRSCNDGRRRRLSRSRSLGSSVIPPQHAEKEAIVNKRRCLRRQSASSRIRQPEEPADNLFEIDDAKFPVVSPSAEGLLADCSCVSELEAQARRTSISRPSRKAVEKVQSYKERPINVKMRRSE
ncbi:SHUGOSHIN 2 isoform X2 [Sesamum indicum]|uniref:SHUGOSHIN 2 isoform X2 n=1 Tax=Sesamum indicum TaxID=4182 RepID=A0A6I9TTB1_SESIN|nr:SHUGOSHIN 2 isoform X2 [Sesamum indicum]